MAGASGCGRRIATASTFCARTCVATGPSDGSRDPNCQVDAPLDHIDRVVAERQIDSDFWITVQELGPRRHYLVNAKTSRRGDAQPAPGRGAEPRNLGLRGVQLGHYELAMNVEFGPDLGEPGGPARRLGSLEGDLVREFIAVADGELLEAKEN